MQAIRALLPLLWVIRIIPLRLPAIHLYDAISGERLPLSRMITHQYRGATTLFSYPQEPWRREFLTLRMSGTMVDNMQDAVPFTPFDAYTTSASCMKSVLSAGE